MKITFNLSILFFTLLWTTNAYCCNKVVLKKTASVQSQMMKEGTTYVVKYAFDLKEAEITVPKNSKLSFQGGCFRNGTIRGNGTTVSAEKTKIFGHVILAGSWSNKKVYSEWLDFVEGERYDNAQNFKNLMLLCAGEDLTHLYMQKGVFYCSVVTGSSNIIVPSNVYWHNVASLRQLPTDSPKYGFVLIRNSENVTIEGGEFVGDVQSHKGNEGEWGHGIKVAGAANVVLKHLTVREFWGDGIDLIEGSNAQTKEYVNCNGVSIENVSCLYNRRQGMSIEAAVNVEIKDSEFAFTGQRGFTKPGAGVDIEPWKFDVEKIKDIHFINCSFHDNHGFDFHCVPNWKLEKEDYINRLNNISLKECRLGLVYVGSTNNISFDKCTIGEGVTTLNDRGGFVSGNDLAVFRITRARATVTNCRVLDDVDDVFMLSIRNSNYDFNLPVVLRNNTMVATKTKQSGPFKYSVDISSSDCCMEGNYISAPQGILLRTDRAQTNDEKVLLRQNRFNLIGGEWKNACLTLRSSNLVRRFKYVEITDNTISGYPFVLLNDSSTHVIKYSGSSDVPLEQGTSLSTITITDGSVQQTTKGRLQYKNGKWQSYK